MVTTTYFPSTVVSPQHTRHSHPSANTNGATSSIDSPKKLDPSNSAADSPKRNNRSKISVNSPKKFGPSDSFIESPKRFSSNSPNHSSKSKEHSSPSHSTHKSEEATDRLQSGMSPRKSVQSSSSRSSSRHSQNPPTEAIHANGLGMKETPVHSPSHTSKIQTNSNGGVTVSFNAPDVVLRDKPKAPDDSKIVQEKNKSVTIVLGEQQVTYNTPPGDGSLNSTSTLPLGSLTPATKLSSITTINTTNDINILKNNVKNLNGNTNLSSRISNPILTSHQVQRLPSYNSTVNGGGTYNGSVANGSTKVSMTSFSLNLAELHSLGFRTHRLPIFC